MNRRDFQREATQRAILNALAELIVESGTQGFSIQQVADRAGVTHRTVYNHFPTREALGEALAVLSDTNLETGVPAPDADLNLHGFAGTLKEAFAYFERHQTMMRAYVMMMIATRGPAGPARDRTKRLARLVGRELGPLPRHVSREIAAAIRMFLSTTGWHVLTEHLGLTTAQAGATAAWAVRVLIQAASEGDLPETENRDA